MTTTTKKPSARRKVVSVPRRAVSKGIPSRADFPELKNMSAELPPQLAVAQCNYLSRFFRDMLHRGSVMPDFYEIVTTLRHKKIPFVVTGIYGMSTWLGFARATKDVDILVQGGRNFARALKALQALYPALIAREAPGVTGLFNPGENYSVIDVIYPHRTDLQATLDTGIWIKDKGIDYRIPTLEASLANKYGAMLNLARAPLRRAQDAVDFGTMVKHSLEPGQTPIDMKKLAALGGLVGVGGAEELVRLVEDAKNGKVPALHQ